MQWVCSSVSQGVDQVMTESYEVGISLNLNVVDICFVVRNSFCVFMENTPWPETQVKGYRKTKISQIQDKTQHVKTFQPSTTNS